MATFDGGSAVCNWKVKLCTVLVYVIDVVYNKNKGGPSVAPWGMTEKPAS